MTKLWEVSTLVTNREAANQEHLDNVMVTRSSQQDNEKAQYARVGIAAKIQIN